MTNSTRSKSQATQPSKAPPFFPVQAQRAPTFFSPAIQTKMSMGAPGDAFEREADAMADQVVQRKFAGPANSRVAPAIQAKCAACHEDEGTLRRQAKTDGSPSVPGGVQKTLEGGTGGGAPMPAPVRDEMESAFGTDFSDVRIHTGSTSEALNQDLNSHAFTHGKDVYFNAGQYRPETPQGQHLLAHELTHVLQQNSGVMRKPKPKSTRKRTTEERDAILATAAQAGFASFDEQVGAQVDAEEVLGLDSKKDKDKPYAWQLGQRDKAQLEKSGTLTTRHQHEITVKIRFFRGEAKRAYLQTINAAISKAAEPEQVVAVLAEPGVPGATEQAEAEGLGCDIEKKQFPILYEGAPERSTCMDITTDKDFAANYFDRNIVGAVTYAVPGTTWENVEYSSFNALVITYKNGKSEYFMLDAVGNFYYGGQALTLREFFYYKRNGTGLIYPVMNGRLYSSELLTPNLIARKNGLQHIVKELQDLYTLLQTAGAFASIIASYSVVEGFRVSLQGFRIPRGMGKAGGGKGGGGGGGGGGDGGEPGSTVRQPDLTSGGGNRTSARANSGTGTTNARVPTVNSPDVKVGGFGRRSDQVPAAPQADRKVPGFGRKNDPPSTGVPVPVDNANDSTGKITSPQGVPKANPGDTTRRTTTPPDLPSDLKVGGFGRDSQRVPPQVNPPPPKRVPGFGPRGDAVPDAVPKASPTDTTQRVPTRSGDAVPEHIASDPHVAPGTRPARVDSPDAVPQPISDSQVTQRIPNRPAAPGAKIEQIGEFRVLGTKELEGGVMHRRIWGLSRDGGPTTDVRPLLRFVGEMRDQAARAGAKTLKITGEFVVNPNIMRLRSFVEARQGTVRVINDTTIEIVIPLSPP